MAESPQPGSRATSAPVETSSMNSRRERVTGTLSGKRAARAGAPSSVYVVPSRVDFQPDEASATKVLIHGAFFFWSGAGPTYTTPQCGYMYLACPQGSEVMCRMQWEDIKNGVGQPLCWGF